jgi:hypothetical protein
MDAQPPMHKKQSQQNYSSNTAQTNIETLHVPQSETMKTLRLPHIESPCIYRKQHHWQCPSAAHTCRLLFSFHSPPPARRWFPQSKPPRQC